MAVLCMVGVITAAIVIPHLIMRVGICAFLAFCAVGSLIEASYALDGADRSAQT